TIIFTINSIGILGYLYGSPLLYGGTVIPMALSTSICFFSLSICFISIIGKGFWPLKPFTGTSTKALLLRSFLPFIVLLILLNGYLRTIAIQYLVNPVLISSISALLCALIVSIIISKIAASIGNSIDQERELRKHAEEELLKEQNTLEFRVQERTAQLSEMNKIMLDEIATRIKAEEEAKKAKIESERAAKVKSDFLATMSHEIRTPMNGVIGMTSLLLNTTLTAEQHEFAEIIRISGDSLLTVINDILDFSKMESGNLELEKRPFELRNCIEDVFDLFSLKAVEKDIDLIYLINHDVPDIINGDENRLRQILVNLVGNAIKFTTKGEVFISVELLKTDDNQHKLQFSVKDTGMGIPSEKIDKLFKPFSQVDSSITRKFGGTGLGLAISKRLIELMDGKIRIESIEEKGTEIFFTIFSEISENIPKVTFVSQLDKLLDKKVLIVDDNLNNLKVLAYQFQQWGMQVTTTTSANKTINFINDNHFDLAIVDMQMPEMDGVELSKKIRENFTKQQLPIVMLTSLDKNKNEIEDADLIFSAYLHKPIKQLQLFNTLINIFSNTNYLVSKVKAAPKINQEMANNYPLRILVAEDNTINQKLALKTLEKMGYKAEIASNGIKVLEMMKKQDYDLIFMDVQMPEMDGLEATKIIIQEFPNRPRIIAMTANAMQGDDDICTKSGMDDYISKPFSIEDLQNILIKWSTKLPTQM
ncbi:response regulator, partial [bacterium]